MVDDTFVVSDFNAAPDFEFGDIGMEVMPTIDGRRKWIEIGDKAIRDNFVMMSMDEARALRDWLNKVIP